MLLRVRRGRKIIRTINPYKSAEKLLAPRNDFYTAQKGIISERNRCTSEPRGINDEIL